MSLDAIPWSKLTHVIHQAVSPMDTIGGIGGISDADADAFTAAAHGAGVRALLCLRDNTSNLTLFSTRPPETMWTEWPPTWSTS